MASGTNDHIDRINRIVSGKQIHPFDFVNNPIFYDPKPGDARDDYIRRLREQTKLASVAFMAGNKGMKFMFVEGAMSNGKLAYDLALRAKDTIMAATEAATGTPYLTTQMLKSYISMDQMMDYVILPNRNANNAFTDAVEFAFPDHAAVGPVDFEGPVRVQRGDNAMSQGASFQDWTFESWWGPVVMACSGMVLGLDHAYSRYTHVEETIGDIIQCGLIDDYRDEPGKTFDIVDLTGKEVTLADRAWETAKHIVDVTEKGFRSDLAVAALIVRFQLDDWLRNGDGPVDLKKVHPTLKNRSEKELAQMDKLKEMMLPYIAEKCAEWMPYNDDPHLKAYFEEKVLPAKGKMADPRIIQDQLFAHKPRGGYNGPWLNDKKPEASKGLKAAFAPKARPAKRRGTGVSPFQTPAKLFDDHHFDQLDVWEQAALKFAVGCMEAARLPENASSAYYYACDPKGGTRAREWADKNDVEWLKEAQGATDQIDDKKNFIKQVIQPNAKDAVKQQKAIAKDLAKAGIQNIVSTMDVLDIDQGIQTFRKAIAAKGPQRLSSRARLALQLETLDRSREGLVLRKGWENHPHETALALRAVMLATGLVERPYEGGKYSMKIFVHNPDGKTPAERFEQQDLGDLILTLGKAVSKELDRQPAVPDGDTYLSCARLLHILDMYRDPNHFNYRRDQDPQSGGVSAKEIVHWHEVNSELTMFWHNDPGKKAEVEAIASEVRKKLLDVGVQFFNEQDVKGLHEDYEAASLRAGAHDQAQRRRKYSGGQEFETRHGPV